MLCIKPPAACFTSPPNYLIAEGQGPYAIDMTLAAGAASATSSASVAFMAALGALGASDVMSFAMQAVPNGVELRVDVALSPPTGSPSSTLTFTIPASFDGRPWPLNIQNNMLLFVRVNVSAAVAHAFFAQSPLPLRVTVTDSTTPAPKTETYAACDSGLLADNFNNPSAWTCLP